jgi:hypothetical protein
VLPRRLATARDGSRRATSDERRTVPAFARGEPRARGPSVGVVAGVGRAVDRRGAVPKGACSPAAAAPRCVGPQPVALEPRRTMSLTHAALAEWHAIAGCGSPCSFLDVRLFVDRQGG